MSSTAAVTDGVPQKSPDVNAQRKLTRVAGVLYLLVVLFGTFAGLVARTSVTVPGDPEATARNVADSAA